MKTQMHNTEIKSKKLIIFDLDGTLALSKSLMDSEMALLLLELLKEKSVAVISGGGFPQFEKQFLKALNAESKQADFSKLFIFPTCSTSFYRYNSEAWEKVYENVLRPEEKEKIFSAFQQVFQETGYVHPEKTYGEVIEDRNSQITFSALGQSAPLELKETFDPTTEKRKKLQEHLQEKLPEFSVRIGGSTSLDVTKKGIDKAYGISKIQEQLSFKKEEMLFLGDALFPGGNDYPVISTGVDCMQVKDPEETKEIIRILINKQH